MNKLFSPTIKKLFITVISQGIILGLSVITGFVLPTKMGPENFGYWQIYLFYLAYLNLFGFGFNDGIALFYGGYYYKDLPFKKLRSSIRAVYFYQALICVIGVGGILAFCDPGIYRTIYLALVVNIPLTCLQCIILTTFLAVGKSETYNYINLILKVLTVSLYIALLFGGYSDPTSMIVVDTVARFIITVVCFILGRNFLFGKAEPIKQGIKEFWQKSKSGFLITIALIASMLMPVLGRMVVERYEPIATYGIYSFAMSLLSIILSFTSVLGTVIFPLLKRMDEGEMIKSYSSFSIICNVFVALALFFYLPLMYIVINIMHKYIPALDYLHFLLAMCLPLGRAQLLITPYYKVMRYEKQLFYANVLGIGTMFISLFGLYFMFKNVIVVAIGTTCILTIWTFVAEIYLNRNEVKQVLKQTLAQIIIMVSFCVAGSFKSYILFSTIYVIAFLVYLLLMKKEIVFLVRKYKKNKGIV